MNALGESKQGRLFDKAILVEWAVVCACPDALSGGGGVTIDNDLKVSIEVEGSWLTISLTGELMEPGFYLLTILEMESLSAKGCAPESVNLQNAIIAGVKVRLNDAVQAA